MVIGVPRGRIDVLIPTVSIVGFINTQRHPESPRKEGTAHDDQARVHRNQIEQVLYRVGILTRNRSDLTKRMVFTMNHAKQFLVVEQTM